MSPQSRETYEIAHNPEERAMRHHVVIEIRGLYTNRASIIGSAFAA
jgi:hypothetical protein